MGLRLQSLESTWIYGKADASRCPISLLVSEKFPVIIILIVIVGGDDDDVDSHNIVK